MEEGSKDLKERTLRSIKQGLGRLWRRRSVTITEYDPSYKVSYLGNVLTGWAKGEGCVEKPLCTLWKNYQSTSKPDVHMKVTVTQSGLKAVTKEHGLTEYWSHRITYCAAPSAFPKVFCWVYRHEGRKLKQELRCHAVLCSKESVARRMAQELRSRLAQALIEFKRDKLSKQNARLSLANSVYDNPSLPRRKILLSTGSQNYRPPLERSKSAPKLMSIEESLEEEDEAEVRKSFRTKERFRILCKAEEREMRQRIEENEAREALFGGDVWGKDSVHVTGEFDYRGTEDFPKSSETGSDGGSSEGAEEDKDCDQDKVELDPRPASMREQEGDSRNRDARMSWGGEDVSERLFDSDLSEYGESVSTTRSESDLPSYRQVIDEGLLDSDTGPDSLGSVDSGVCAGRRRHYTLQNRKKLLESLLETEVRGLEAGFTKLYQDLDYAEEESTPSLQSISSGSDRDCGRPVNLDSLSEEESDESGFAEVGEGGHGPGSDDKARDLPHHQLVKSCILTTKSHCVQV